MNLKEFIHESKGTNLAPEEYVSVVGVVKKCINLFSMRVKPRTYPVTPRYFSVLNIKKHISSKPRYLVLDKIRLLDKESNTYKVIKILVVYNHPTTSDEAVFLKETNEIILFYDTLYNASYYKLFEIVSHEIIHAIQYYKKTSLKYTKAVSRDINNDPELQYTYYTEPLEFEATVGGILAKINAMYNNYIERIIDYREKDDKGAELYFVRKLSVFLKEYRQLATSPFDVYLTHQELDLPVNMREREQFLSTIQNNKKLKRKYQSAMLSLIDSLYADSIRKNIELDL